MVKAIVNLTCNKCGAKYTYLDMDFDPYLGNTAEGDCHYCYAGTRFYDVIYEGEEGFDEAYKNLKENEK